MKEEPNTWIKYAYVHAAETQAFEAVTIGLDRDVYIFLPTDLFEVIEPSLNRNLIVIRKKVQ